MVVSSGACLAVRSAAAEGTAQEPAICAQAVSTQPGDALKALARAESEAWKEAKAVKRESRKLAKGTLGMGASTASVRATAKMAELDDHYQAALARARQICGCRERRGDPHRENCDDQYARFIQPARR